MEVLYSNFTESLPIIKKAILEADFIAIDAEFTGLHPSNIHLYPSDDPQTRYDKIRNSVKEFTVIQYGICAFKRTGDRYVASPFNFYIFGRDTNEIAFHRSFLSSASSLSFLLQNNFDFNKLIAEGIPFCNYTEEEAMYPSSSGTTLVDPRLYVESSVRSFLLSFAKHNLYSQIVNRTKISEWLQAESQKPLIIQTNSGFQKKLIYQEIRKSYNGFLKAATRDTKHLQITKLSEEERRSRPKASRFTGPNFRTVIDLINEAGVPVVAHNGLFDLCHSIDQFWRYLPQNMVEFKKTAKEMWPNCFQSTVLGNLYAAVQEEMEESGPKVVMAENFDRYQGQSFHEAGYDAYITGYVYIAFVHFILEKQEETQENSEKEKSKIDDNATVEHDNHEADSDSENDSDNENDDAPPEPKKRKLSLDTSDSVTSRKLFLKESLTPYYNRIYLMRCDYPYIDLEKTEEYIFMERANRFFLSNIPIGLSKEGLEKIFHDLAPLSIFWVNDSQAWMDIKHPNRIELAKSGLVGVEKILPFLVEGAEGNSYGITADAAKILIMTHKEWREKLSPTASTDAGEQNVKQVATDAKPANGVANANTSSKKSSTVPASSNTMPMSTQLMNNEVPTGGSSYDGKNYSKMKVHGYSLTDSYFTDLDIPLPPSFQRLREPSNAIKKATHNQQHGHQCANHQSKKRAFESSQESHHVKQNKAQRKKQKSQHDL
ncbi:CAF1 family ribonuclease-domain-containing protein [Radiomyces spectabilis]|uniref:CAF1 family ribonuclease-domain-containing protein n=1 Tax=Radiomyces spectabilis TaxID=64574 RepID=UPI002221093D|nr:CAF1 family ribonuclease-domain-containing protein [Radiomyces spectabilis]KAI8370663.1 CAF1 family ribonuclease-domain-containing protein [Radiomyces spectabilis]